MKAFTGLLVIHILEGIQAEEQSKPASRSCENFAGELYQRVRKSLPDDVNFVISPLGVSSLLGTLLLAVNQTAGTEISNFLYPKCASSSESALGPTIRQRQGSQIQLTTIAMVQTGVTVDKRFEENAAEQDCRVFKVDFNDFDRHKTSFLPMDALLYDTPFASNRLLFYNNFIFQAQFEQKFSLVDGNLVAPRVQALHADVAELKARVLGLPLHNTTAILLILVPNEGVNLRSVEGDLRKVDMRKLPSRLNPSTMDITLENIVERSYLYLRNALQRAGITSVFNRTTTELSAFNGELPLNNVLVYSGISLNADGINTAMPNYHIKKAVIREADSVTYPEFKALGSFVYAVVDSERVYLMGRRLVKGS